MRPSRRWVIPFSPAPSIARVLSMHVPENAAPEGGTRWEHDNVVILSEATWEQFETLLAMRGDAPVPRMAYLDGQVELMSPSKIHEVMKKTLGRLVEAYGDTMDLQVEGRGSETLRLPLAERGAEPDECYDVGESREFPRLVIEVVKSSRGLDKFQIYAEFEIEEFWRWVDGEFSIYRLEGHTYVPHDESALLPGMTCALVSELLALGSQTAAVRALRSRLVGGE